MTIQEALNKAVEGGYHMYGSDGMDTYYAGANSEFSAWTRKDNDSSFMVPTEETFLDPQFWRALGCTLGWSEACDLTIICGHGHEECCSYRGYYWMYQWHRFIQVLANGTPPDTFFAHLPSSRCVAVVVGDGRKGQHSSGGMVEVSRGGWCHENAAECLCDDGGPWALPSRRSGR